MESSKLSLVLNSIGVTLCVAILVFQLYLHGRYNTISDNQKSFRMYYEKNIQGQYADRESVTGLYYRDDDYYCVWTKDRALTEIKKTDYHESCHAMIDLGEREHFCGVSQ